MTNITQMSDLREARSDRDSVLAKKLIVEVWRLSIQLVRLIQVWEKEIHDPQQLKALIEETRTMMRKQIDDTLLDIEVAHNLDRLDLCDDEI